MEHLLQRLNGVDAPVVTKHHVRWHVTSFCCSRRIRDDVTRTPVKRSDILSRESLTDAARLSARGCSIALTFLRSGVVVYRRIRR